MKKTMTAVAVLAALPLVGCGMSAITPSDVALEDARARAKADCVRARAEADISRMNAIGKLPESQQGMAMMGDAMARQSENLSGKDPCGQGMGAYDIRAVEVREKNATAREGIGAAKSGSVVLYGIDRFSHVAEKGISSAGDRTTQTASEGSSISYTQERVTSNSETTTKNFGEGGTASSGAPTVSGPDKSSTTVHEAAPEEPVVEAEEPATETPEPEAPAEEVAE